jgi:DNA-binding beta-propeller fold protein YncE
MKIYYTITALLLALSCTPKERPRFYADIGRLNFPEDSWEPAAVAFALDETVYVADSSMNCAVQVFNAEGLYIGGIGGLGKGPGKLFVPTDVAVGPKGNIYVAEFGTHRVSIFGRDGTFRKTVGERYLAGPLGVAVGRDGKIYVADAEGGGLLVFSADGEHLETWGEERETGQILDVAVAADGSVAFAPSGTGDVAFFPGYGGGPVRLKGAEEPTFVATEVAFGPGGDFFILGRRTDEGGTAENIVKRLSSGGELLEEVELTLTSPTGLAVAADGTMYVADGTRHEVRIYRPRAQNDRDVSPKKPAR